MDNLRRVLRATSSDGSNQPFSIYTAVADQSILNVPIIKPLLICVLDGRKELGAGQATVNAGEFVFLSNTPNIDMRNIPQGAVWLDPLGTQKNQNARIGRIVERFAAKSKLGTRVLYISRSNARHTTIPKGKQR